MRIIQVDQNSDEWFHEREGRITGSRSSGVVFAKLANKEDMQKAVIKAHDLPKDDVKRFSMQELEELLPEDIYREMFHKAQKKEYYRILAEKMGYDDLDDDGLYEDPRDRGHRLEDAAVEKVEKEFGVIAMKVGLCVDDDYDSIAISPDRLIPADDTDPDDIETFEASQGELDPNIHFIGAIEIKNPGVANHLEITLTNEIPSEYWKQCLQYFVVTDIDYLHFVSHNPKVIEHPLHIITVYRKDVKTEVEEQRKQQIEIIKNMEKDISLLTF